MNFKGARLELEHIEEEICTLEAGSPSKETKTVTICDAICKRLLLVVKTGPFTVICCAIQVIVFLLKNDRNTSKFCYAPDKRDEVWRMLTYAFFHTNTYHLVPNLLFLTLVGIVLEHDQGSWRTSVVYVSGIISGALGCNVLKEDQKVIGTSAASYSLLLAHLPHIKLNWRSVRFKDYRIVAINCLLLSDVISYTLSSFFFPNISVSWSSHFGASVNGFLIGGIIFSAMKPSHCYRYVCLSIYTVLMTFSLIIYFPWLCDITCQYSSNIHVENLKINEYTNNTTLNIVEKNVKFE